MGGYRRLEIFSEEADTRILLHALHAGKSGYKAAVIIAEDTDVLILCLGFSKDIYAPYTKSVAHKIEQDSLT